MVVLTHVLFIDGFKLKKQHLGYLCIWLTFVTCAHAIIQNVMTSEVNPNSILIFNICQYSVTSGVLVLYLYSLWIALKSWKADLVEKRRELRFFVVLLILTFSVLIYLIQLLTAFNLTPYFGWTTVVISFVSIYIIYRIAKVDRNFFSDTVYSESERKQSNESSDPLLQKLQEYMTATKSFCKEQFDIRFLARDLHIPEYKLRQVINRQLGYRNFNEYLHDYRISEAVAELTSGDKPVLNIALDVGYRNMSTFHKAFKERKGITPHQFRLQNRAS